MPFEKQAQGKDATLFSKPEYCVYAISKTDRGDTYLLDQERFAFLVDSARYARVRLTETLALLSKMMDLSSEGLVRLDGSRKRKLSPLGLLADHFNLIKVRTLTPNESNYGNWHYPFDFKCKANHGDLVTLVNTVKAVLTAASQGLSGDILFRGLTAEQAQGAKGMVRFKRSTGTRPERLDTFFPEDQKFLDKKFIKQLRKGQDLTAKEREKILMKIPKLKDDEVFLNPEAQGKGFIHLSVCAKTPQAA